MFESLFNLFKKSDPLSDVVKGEAKLPEFKLPLKRILGVIIAAVIILPFAFSSVHIIKSEELGVVTTLGKVSKIEQPGINIKLPWPIQSVYKVNVKQVYRLELGYRTIKAGPPAVYDDVPAEAIMLTGDENIVQVTAAVQYVISDPVTNLFRIDNYELSLRKGSESVLREVVGRYTIDDVLTDNKSLIQEECRRQTQALADSFNMGVTIKQFKLQDVHPPDQVINAFKKVASAKENKQTTINEAQAYRSEFIPQARGEAEQIIREAEAQKESRVLRSEGDVAKFLEMYKEYVNSKTVTRSRLYLEAMEEILKGKEIYIMSDDNSMKILPLGEYVGGGN